MSKVYKSLKIYLLHVIYSKKFSVQIFHLYYKKVTSRIFMFLVFFMCSNFRVVIIKNPISVKHRTLLNDINSAL